MKEIILDNTLVADNENFNKFDPEYYLKDSKGFEPITVIDAEITHMNYLMYLCQCWKRHYGVIISPTILWNMVLCNLAYEVNKNPNTYRKYFTESEEKQDVLVQQGGNRISVLLLVDAIHNKIPNNIIEDFFPAYSTDTERSVVANYTAFLDMVSPYYNYFMYLCGIPKIKVLGTEEDWLSFEKSCVKISEAIPEFEEYLSGIREIIIGIIDGDIRYENMFRLDRCGSGSQANVAGWIREFFIEQPRVAYPENFISCISKIDYHNYNDNQDYRMYAGLFTSTIEDGYLVPDFGNIYFRKTAEEPKSAVDANTVNLNVVTKTVKGEIRVVEIDFSKIQKK